MGIVRQIKNVAGGYSSSQIKVRDATANDESRPPRHLLQELADLSYDKHEVMLIMDMIDKRLNDKGKYWRHVFKALILLDYLVHVGGNKVVTWCRDNLYIIKTLREFNYRDDTGRDVGASIRDRARSLTSLLMDTERLEQERERYARGGAGRRPKRYRARDALEDARRDRGASSNDDDDDLKRALELSKQTAAEEEERRRMAGRTNDDFQAAASLTQQNQASMLAAVPTGAFTYDPFLQQQQDQQNWLLQQQQEAQQLAQAQADFLAAQQQAQQEAQLLYTMQQQQAEAEAQQRAAQEAYKQQMMQQQQQQQNLQPLKTGSNNPFAAFSQIQQQPTTNTNTNNTQQQQQSTGSLSRRPSMHRQSTFDQEHMDRLDRILNLDAPMDTFGNTGMAKIPAQHTENTGFVDSSGRGLTAMLTARKTGEQQNGGASSSNNPFASGQHYTGIASTQMQPAHTGYGFGNANSSSSTNLIDL